MMNRKSWMTPVVAAALLFAAACTGNSLDDSSAPDVFLEIETFDNPAITAQATEGTCVLEVVSWSATIAVVSKNELATPPFNDVVMEEVILEYYAPDDFDFATLLFGPRRVMLGDVVIPTGASNAITFEPISFDDLGTYAGPGSTLNLLVTFVGRTIEGTSVRVSAGRQLFIENCVGG